MRKTSAAVIYTDREKVLVEVATGDKFGKHHCDLPKGIVEDGETAIQAAIREVYEETGIVLEQDRLKDIGKFPYNEEKDLALFLYITDNLVPIEQMKCISTFSDSDGEKPEVCEYHYIDKDQLEDYLYYTFSPIIKYVNLRGIYDK